MNPQPERSGRRLARDFRWQALFQRTADPLFLLDRRRLLFVNRAWEELTGVPAAEAHVLVCRRHRPASPDDSPEEILAHALTPPPEVLQGAAGRVRRLLPATIGGAALTRWWDVEFFPLRQQDRTGGFVILGRILPVSAAEAAGMAPLPERLMNLRERQAHRHGFELWASPLPAVRRLVARARLASQVTAPVLLVGEPGTGKQTLARAIHYQGPRREAAFAALDCTRLPPAAVAAVLFEGGPTAAVPARRGVLGAVYLKEPSRLPRDLQLRLCEWLTAAGERRGVNPPVRVLAGCAAPPAEEVRAGRLLEELACALGTLVIEVPPLRERREDLPGLVERLLHRASSGSEVRVTGLTPEAWEVVRAYPWPGNLRELYAALRTAQGRAYGERIAAADLPAPIRQAVHLEQTPGRPAERKLPLDQLLEQAERRLIELALRRARGHKTRAAEILSIWRQRLTRRMEALGIADTEEGESKIEDRG